ncbi:unnamed protein product [Mytilus edulis]|uniref:Uncharacterized protein n=1 Tax=Mytilus edulis TaxID=6550 RepID=A0A8S3Q8X2_MYTED|nr:unnamed protein product [Mytilus edulis]
MSSHNSKYYVKKLKNTDGNKSRKILSFFKPRAVIDDAATACNESEAALSETESIENVTDVVDVSSNDNLISNDDQSQTNTDSLLIQPEDQACKFQTQTEICKPNNEIPTMKPSSSKVMTVLGSTDSKTALNDKLKVYDVSDRRLFDARRYEMTYKWLYYNESLEGYVCKYCELFPFGSTDFSSKGVILGDHPTRQLQKHEMSNKHQQSSEKSSS